VPASKLHQLLPGVVVLERGWLSANGVLFVEDHRSALVDTGYCTHSPQTVALVESQLQERTLDLVLNTHLHSDHCGGNAALQSRYPSVTTLIPPGQLDHVVNWDPVALSYEPTGQQCPRFRVSGVLEPGIEIELGHRHWQVHAAPGHDAHSVVLYEPGSRVLISADALWENGFGVIFDELEGRSAFDEVAATLDLIEALDPAVVIPGHGAVFDDAPAALERARARLASFMADPRRHATYAAKVLLKFKLLEAQQIGAEDFSCWAMQTPYFAMVWKRWFQTMDIETWLQDLIGQLLKSGAATQRGDLLLNA
jgi:glyoxylase-like metal-dependent hydrolase (beta-lactamase superfamily II)